MDIIDFFDSDILQLPKFQNNDRLSFYRFLKKSFKDYLKLIDSITSTDRISLEIINNKKQITLLSNNLLKAIELHYSGHTFKAFKKVDKVLRGNDIYLQSLLSSPNIARELNFLYRMRLGESFQFSKKDLFHIPFELRHKVDVKRYSITGLPCLYFGGSAYICWEEMNRPDLHKIHIARFAASPTSNIRLLDFGYRPAHIAAMLDNYKNNITTDYENFAIAQGIFWPLICSCSIKVKESDAPFKPEYLIPQYLLQWISSNSDCDGIRYFSCRLLEYPNNITAVSNFVFPAKTFKDNGYCDVLAQKFWLSNPICWQLAKALNPTGTTTPNIEFNLTLTPNYSVNYSNTEFADMQFVVALDPPSSL